MSKKKSAERKNQTRGRCPPDERRQFDIDERHRDRATFPASGDGNSYIKPARSPDEPSDADGDE